MNKIWLPVLVALLLGSCRHVEVPQLPPALPTATGRPSPVATTVLEPVCPPAVTPGLGLQPQALLESQRSGLAELGDIPRYSIALDLVEPFDKFSARASLAYTNTEAVALDELYFHLLPNGGKSYGDGWLEVDVVWRDGQPLDFILNRRVGILQVLLKAPLEVGESLVLFMDFRVGIPQDFGGETTGAYGILNHAEGVLALSGWYPMLAVYDDDGWNLDPVSAIGDSVYADAATFQVELGLPLGYRFASTGVEIGQPEGTTHCLVSGPVREFFIIAARDFQVLSKVVDGVRVNAFHLAGHQAGGQAALEIASDSLGIYNRKFGPYPYAELDVVEAPLRNALGVEFPGTILIASSLYDEPDGDNFVVATAHEVAHQWWYNLVGNDVFEEPWLDEGLTSFSSSLYYEQAFGTQGYGGLSAYWQARYDKLVESGKDDQVTRPLAYFEGLGDPRIYGTVVYTKAALFFMELRKEMGDEQFFGALQQYYTENRYQVASGEDLLRAFRENGGPEVDALIARWLAEP